MRSLGTPAVPLGAQMGLPYVRREHSRRARGRRGVPERSVKIWRSEGTPRRIPRATALVVATVSE